MKTAKRWFGIAFSAIWSWSFGEMAMEIRRKTVVISPIRNRFFGEMKPPFRRYGETKKPVIVLIIFVNIWLLRFWAMRLIAGVFTANVRLVDSNAILRGLLTHYFLTWHSVMRGFVWGMRIKGVYQNWRSPGVQKSGSSVITIMIPYYQILMHLTELLNFRTSELLLFWYIPIKIVRFMLHCTFFVVTL